MVVAVANVSLNAKHPGFFSKAFRLEMESAAEDHLKLELEGDALFESVI